MKSSVLFWFRKGLRLHDNPALVAALEGAAALYPVFCIEPNCIEPGRVGVNRARFLLESLADLDASLHTLDSRLIVLRGDPRLELERMIREHSIDRLAYEVDTEPRAMSRDAEVCRMASGAGVEVMTRPGHTLCDLEPLVARFKGESCTSYQAFLAHFKAEIKARPIRPLAAPTRLPPMGGAANCGGVPTLASLGYTDDTADSCVIVRGGETVALERMRRHLAMPTWVATFEKPKTDPTEKDPFGEATRSTTVLSPHLAHGCLSARLFYTELADVYAKAKNHAEPPVSLHGQLLWREFFHANSYATPNWDKMVGNPVSRQVPWDADNKVLQAWRDGRTGYPWIDAIMTQLKREGWIHHLARHSVACFLTRGDLWQSWEKARALQTI